MGARVNGTYHTPSAARRNTLQTRLLIGVGAFLTALGMLNVVLTNADMSRIEQSGPARLALAGGGIDRFVPSLLATSSAPTPPPPP